MFSKIIITNSFFIDASGNPVTQVVISVTDASGNSVTGKILVWNQNFLYTALAIRGQHWSNQLLAIARTYKTGLVSPFVLSEWECEFRW